MRNLIKFRFLRHWCSFMVLLCGLARLALVRINALMIYLNLNVTRHNLRPFASEGVPDAVAHGARMDPHTNDNKGIDQITIALELATMRPKVLAHRYNQCATARVPQSNKAAFARFPHGLDCLRSGPQQADSTRATSAMTTSSFQALGFPNGGSWSSSNDSLSDNWLVP